MNKNATAFSKRELIALNFAIALVAARENKPDDHPSKTNAATMRDAFSFARAFESECLDGKHRSRMEKV